MRKIISLFVLGAMLVSFPTGARELSESEALSRAGAFLSSTQNGMKHAPSGKQNLKLAYKSAKSFYVFDRGIGDGFVIVSANDRMPEVLGYSDSGTFDYQTLPPDMKWWLAEYEKEIRDFLASDNSSLLSFVPEKASDSREMIAPLVTTKWNQSDPYNNLCPTDAGGRSVTGCVATALAQIVNYHKWPQGNGTGTYSYEWNGTPLSFDYGSTSFAWDKMRDEYNSSSPADACAAVAELMYACGVGVNMKYSSRESSAYNFGISRVLVENLGYSGGVSIRSRDNYSAEQWEDLIYSELASGRPVLYTGQAESGGHAFVCDGYEGNRYFHINWGWGGMSDGYFLLSALNPNDQGIGSFEGGYNSDQSAIIGIRPQDGVKYNANLLSNGTFEWQNGNYYSFTNVYNYSFSDQNVTFGISAVSESTGDTVEFWGGALKFSAADLNTGQCSGYSRFSLNISPSGLAAGEYKLYPIYKNDSGAAAERLIMPYGQQQYVFLTVGADGTYTYSNPGTEIKTNLEVLSFGAAGKVYQDTQALFNISIKNNSVAAYNDIITIEVQKDGESLDKANVKLSIAAGQTFSGSYSHSYSFAPGDYDVFLYDAEGTKLNSIPFSLRIEEGTAPVLPDGLSVEAFSPNGFYRGYTTTISVTFANNSASDITTDITFNVYTPGDKTSALFYSTVPKVAISANKRVRYNISGFSLKDQFGNYEIEIVDGGNKKLCERIPVSNYDKYNGLWYGLSDDNTVKVVPAPVSEAIADGIIDVPVAAELNGKSYDVAGIDDNAFSMYSGVESVFLRPSERLFTSTKALYGVNSADVYVPAALYADYADILAGGSNNVYSIIDRISYSNVSGNPEALTLNSDYVFAVAFEPSENVNSAIEVSGDDSGLMSFEVSDFASGVRNVTARAMKIGDGSITVSSAQPGVEALTIPVKVTDISSVEDALGGSIEVYVINGNVYITGLEAGDAVEVFNTAGVKVAALEAVGTTETVAGLGRGFYIVRAGGLTAKVSI